jgi:hypothetical protein
VFRLSNVCLKQVHKKLKRIWRKYLTVNPPLSKEEIKLPEHGIVSLPRFYCHHGLYVVYFAIFYFVVSIYICCWLGVASEICDLLYKLLNLKLSTPDHPNKNSILKIYRI